MNQIRIAALHDLRDRIPATHYLVRPHSLDADLDLASMLLRAPEGLTPLEHSAAQALKDWAYFEKLVGTMSNAAFPARDSDDQTPAPGFTPDQTSKIATWREVHHRSALAYARRLDDPDLIERYQPPASASDTDPAQTTELGGGAGSAIPESQRRLIRLRSSEVDGEPKYKNGRWSFIGSTKLAKLEKSEGRKRSDEKTVRLDLIEAAEAERQAKRAGFFF